MNPGPYHLFPIGILLVLAYLGSLLSVRMQLVDVSRHRKFWNSFLLLFFISTALLGLLLAVKVNYKLTVSWVDAVMQWHVDLGIGLACVAAFHLTWHLGYYIRMLSRRPALPLQESIPPYLDLDPLKTRTFFSLLGAVTMITQLVLLREYIKTLHGNELVIGLFLALWMILTALGARAGSVYRARIRASTLFRIMLFLAAGPVLLYLALMLLARVAFLPGIIPGILASLSLMMLILPFTLVSGFLFAFMVRALKGREVNARYYMLESLGSMAGGILFAGVLVYFLNNMQVITLVFALTTLMVALFFRYPSHLPARILLPAGAALLFVSTLFPGVTLRIEGMRYRGEILLQQRDTPQGHLAVTDRDGLRTLYLDRNPLISSLETAVCEERVHYAALQHPAPSSFLVMGGGLAGLEKEVLKYDPAVFDYCETNPWIYRLTREYIDRDEAPPASPLRYVKRDGRNWLSASDASYDVILSLAGEPMTLGWNRFFTREFFQLVRSSLTPDGVFCLQLPAAGNYLDDLGSEQLAITYHTLEKVFEHVLVIPGYATYILASGFPLSMDIPALAAGKGLSNTYVNSDYLDGSRIAFENATIMERIQELSTGINSDLRPVLFFTSISSWSLRIGNNKLIYIALASVLIAILILASYSRHSTGMFVAGFSGAGMQILLILVMQSYFGFAYLVTPLMITLFMGGLVCGTLLWKMIWRGPSVSKTTGLLWILAMVGAAAVVLLKGGFLTWHRWIGTAVLGMLNFLPGMVVGSIYGILLAISRSPAAAGAGQLYSADLAGAALGCLIPPLFLVPLIGIPNTFILFCALNVAAGLYLQTGRMKK